jgi:hypothetical protein
MLHWKARFVAVAAILALLLIALGGGWLEDVLYNLYW